MRRKRKNRSRRTIHLIAHSHPKLPISEQYRQIRTNIQFSSVDKEIKSIMVTSPKSGDGKSTTVANLAIVLSQQGKSILLVGTDLRKPSFHYAFRISNMNGLTNVLTREVSLNEAICKTYVPNLEILPSGPIPPNPSELLSSKAMDRMMEELKDRFDFVIYDTPPVLAVTDPQIIASKCDGVIMVVASGKTQREHALKTKELLENVTSNILGVVVNGIKSSKREYYSEYK